MLIVFTPRVCVGVEEDVAPPTIAAESVAASWAYDDEEEEKAEVEAEADLRLLDPVLGEDAAPANDSKHQEEDDDTGDRGNQGPKEGREGRETRSGDGNGDRDRDGPGPNTLCSLWGQMSLAARVGSRYIASGTSWHFGSNFFVGPRDEDGMVSGRTMVISGPGPGPRPRARASVPSWPRGGSVVHGWMLRCVGLCGV
jgi:hypothetical protein